MCPFGKGLSVGPASLPFGYANEGEALSKALESSSGGFKNTWTTMSCTLSERTFLLGPTGLET